LVWGSLSAPTPPDLLAAIGPTSNGRGGKGRGGREGKRGSPPTFFVQVYAPGV